MDALGHLRSHSSIFITRLPAGSFKLRTTLGPGLSSEGENTGAPADTSGIVFFSAFLKAICLGPFAASECIESVSGRWCALTGTHT